MPDTVTPQPALVTARPWSDVDARAGLLALAAVAEVEVGGHLVRVVCEPLITHDDAGTRLRAIRLDVDGLGAGVDVDPAAVVVSTPDGQTLTSTPTDAPAGSLRLLVPASEEERRVRLVVPTSRGEVSCDAVLDVAKEWTIHLVHQSHLDIGYTDPQPVIQAQQRSYLDSVLDLSRATDDWPAAARFRWAVESLWTFEQWAELRPAADVKEFLERVRRGQLELTAMPYNLHTDTCSTDELHELLRRAREVRDRYGVTFSSAMQTDVPGTVAGLPDALAEVGVKYLAVAHNWAGRSMPQTNGGDELPRLFRWSAPSGVSVLVWMTDTPHGLAYMEGPFLGFHDGYDSVDRLLPAYLTNYAHHAYPYPPGVLGWHGEHVTTREPYPWDILHIRTQGWVGDNAPARLVAPEIVRRWNDTWDFPKLQMSTNEEFFAEAERRVGDQLQTFEGDWGDWWVEGVGSAALPQALVRTAQARITDGQTLSQLSRLVGGQVNDAEVAQARSGYEAISMFNEHTWGASNSWLHDDAGASSGDLQWHWKAAHASIAQERTEALVERSSAMLGAGLPRGEDALASYYAVNTTAVPRSSTVRFLLREAVVGTDVAVELRDARSGEALPLTEGSQDNITHREAGRWLRVRVPDVPALGLVRLDVVAAASTDEDAVPGREEHPGSGLPRQVVARDTGHPELPDVPRSQLLTLQNEFLRVRVDEQRSCIASVVDLSTGAELVNQQSVVGFNAYVYDTYTSAPGYNHQSNKTATGPKLELLGSRSLARPSVVVERVDDAVEQRIVLEFAADGVDRARTTLRLPVGEPVLHIENQLSKPSTMTKESGFFAFPFAVTGAGEDEGPTVRYEISGAVTGDGLDHVPGAPQHMRAIRHWATLSGDGQDVAWVTKDAPLVHPQTIALPYAPFPDSTSPREPGTLYSWVHNNVWDTNFPVEQGFQTTFSYAIGVPGGRRISTEGLAQATTAASVHPLVAVQARGPVGGGPVPTGALLAVDDDRVRVVSVLAAEDPGALQVRLQSFADVDVEVTLSTQASLAGARASTWLGDDLGELAHQDGRVRLSVPRLGVAAAVLTLT